MDGTHTTASESVWSGISLSGEQDHQKKHQHRRSKREYEKEVEDLKKDSASCKLQLEAKHAAYMQALRKGEHYQRLNSELFSLLKKFDSQRKKHMNEGNDRGFGIGELESMMKEVDDQLGNPRFREQISRLLSELKTREGMLLNKEVELLAAKDSELKAQTKIEEMEIAFNIEKEEKQQILQQLEELKVEKQRENHNDKGQTERKSMDETVHVEALETELNKLKQELVNAKKEENGLKAESLTGAMNKIKEKNTDDITIPLKEYESLIRKVEQANEAKASMTEGGSLSETAMLKTELEAATAKIGELRARAEQALSRAELAEKAKADLEQKLKRHRDKQQRRKAAMAALEEESTPAQFSPSSSGATPQVYEPLSKILNLKL
ncbi:caldesmon-like [Neltuma alba]|uniref:caldesmon-like n=1 Tax=Neltuma alba TaxID=207710 RepID=UPI0010A4C955|nr:caldesmon-like [Prosopis alba]